MRPIDRVVQVRKSARRSIEVPEWGMTLYFGLLTHNDVQAVRDRLRDGGKDPEHHREEERLLLLVQKAELEDGARAFEFGDMHALRENMGWAIEQRLLAFMYASSFPETGGDLEDAKKKSEPTRVSSGDSSSASGSGRASKKSES